MEALVEAAQIARKRPLSSSSDGSDEADVELGGEAMAEDPALQLFDLDPRLHRTNLEHQWAVEAKVKGACCKHSVWRRAHHQVVGSPPHGALSPRTRATET